MQWECRPRGARTETQTPLPSRQSTMESRIGVSFPVWTGNTPVARSAQWDLPPSRAVRGCVLNTPSRVSVAGGVPPGAPKVVHTFDPPRITTCGPGCKLKVRIGFRLRMLSTRRAKAACGTRKHLPPTIRRSQNSTTQASYSLRHQSSTTHPNFCPARKQATVYTPGR